MSARQFNVIEEPKLSTLSGKSAIITGGASGIGAGIGSALARNGVFVTIADVNIGLGEALAASLNNEGHKAQFHHTDVTSFESQLAAFKAHVAASPNKTIDIVIPSAGIAPNDFVQNVKTPSINTSEPPTPATATLTVNAQGQYLTAHLACWYFAKSAAGKPPGHVPDDNHLLLISSLAGYTSIAMAADYSMSKAAVRGLFKSIRDGMPFEFGAGARVNMLAPTYVDTPMTAATVQGVRMAGITVATINEVVEDMLRLCCNKDIKGRAVVTVTGGQSFDLCDNREHMDGAIQMRQALCLGLFGAGYKNDPMFDVHLRYKDA